MKLIVSAVMILLSVALAILLLPNKAKDIEKGNQLYYEQKYGDALRQYVAVAKKDPYSDVVNFNMGAAMYKMGNFEKILSYFKNALLTEDPKLKEKAHYNLGNVLYRIGMQKKETDLKATITLLEQ